MKTPPLWGRFVFGAPGEIGLRLRHCPVNRFAIDDSGLRPSPFGRTACVLNRFAIRSNSEFECYPELKKTKGPRWGPFVFFGAPGEIRTPDRPVRSRVLYPAELRAHFFNYKFSGGERGIRTLEGVLALTPLAGERFRPLSHLSIGSYPLPYGAPRERHSTDRCTQGKAPRRYSPGLSSCASPEAFSLWIRS